MQLTPSRTITVGATEYPLDGSFRTLRAIQEYFKKDIVLVLIGIMDMPFYAVADLIAIASGKPDTADAIGQVILDDIGPMSSEYMRLKTELTAWLSIAISPQKDREKKKAEMQAILDKLPNSLGSNTASSA